ncbi:MAG: hypothetical protein HQL01_11730 [Nitrospirae bacterium]|nr:hypothetical protein [Nitrospirota bacterium]
MTAASGAAFLAFNLKRICHSTIVSSSIFTFLILSLLVFDNTMARAGFNMLTRYQPLNVATEPISLYIRENTKDNDTIWVPSYDKYIYLQSGRLSPSKYVYLFEHFFFLPSMKETSMERMRSLKADLQRNQPVFIFLKRENELNYLNPVGIPQWVKENYTLDSMWHDGYLLKKASLVQGTTDASIK